MYAYTPANSMFGGPIRNLFSVLCILVEVLSRAHAKRVKSLKDFKFGTSVGRFSSGGAASMAVKGLMAIYMQCVRPSCVQFNENLLMTALRAEQLEMAEFLLDNGVDRHFTTTLLVSLLFFLLLS